MIETARDPKYEQHKTRWGALVRLELPNFVVFTPGNISLKLGSLKTCRAGSHQEFGAEPLVLTVAPQMNAIHQGTCLL